MIAFDMTIEIPFSFHVHLGFLGLLTAVYAPLAIHASQAIYCTLKSKTAQILLYDYFCSVFICAWGSSQPVLNLILIFCMATTCVQF